jgi:IstB-like ATP binding protein
MTEESFVPTFSHQAAGPDKPAAPGGSLKDAIADAQAALERRMRFVEPDPVGDRKRALEGFLASLPVNARRPRRELEEATPERLLAAAKAWGWDDGNLLVLGASGVGKTSGLAYLVRRLCARAAAVGGEEFERAKLTRWQSCRDLSEAMREHPLGQGTPEAVQRCQNARLLVLDDVGSEDNKPALERILNTRYERCWPTITTSGLTSRELTQVFGEALVRRMLQREGKNGRIINLFEARQP